MAARTIPYQVAPLAKHTATVIFLHGLGDTGNGWLGFAEMVKNELPHVKWLLPNAPHRNITINSGFSMPGWFDLYSFDPKDGREDSVGMLDSARTIDKLIQDEIDTGIPAERIAVGGFSQGGCMSLLAGLTARENGLFGGRAGWKLGGVAVLSGWLPLRREFPKIVSAHLKSTPVLICHGTADPLVPYVLGTQTREILTKNLGLPALDDPAQSPSEDKLGVAGLSFRTYNDLGHSTCQQELKDLTQFLKRVLPRD